AVTATAWWFGFVEFPTLPQPIASQLDPRSAEVGVQRSDAAGVPNHGQLIVRDQKGVVNEPLAIGVSLRGGSGREIVILSGFVAGTQLSLGTSLSSARWSLPAEALDKAFIAAPKDFSGTMKVTAKLYSSSSELLQTQLVHFAWSQGGIEQATPVRSADAGRPLSSAIPVKGAESASPIDTAVLSPNKAAGMQSDAATNSTASLPAQEIATLLANGERLLREGDIVTARLALRRAAEAGSADAAYSL